MKRIFLACLLLVFPTWAEQAVLTYAVEGHATPLTFTTLKGTPRTFAVQGLPFPGEVLWRPDTDQLAYRHPAEGSWLLATPALLQPSAVSTSTLPRAAGPNFQGAPTQRWAQNRGSTNCGVLFGSATLGQQQGLNVGDFQQLYRLLYWLNTGETPQGCGNAISLAATAPQVGLPTRWDSPLGRILFQGVALAPENLTPATWPNFTFPVTPEVRLRLLLVQLPVPARAAFMQATATLPLLGQIEKLTQILNKMAASSPH